MKKFQKGKRCCVVLSEKIDYQKDQKKLKKHKDWIIKLESALDKYDEHGIKTFVLKGKPSMDLSDEKKFIEFEHESIVKIDTVLDDQQKKKVFSECSCTYPKEKLQKIKQKYQATKDLKEAHQMLQEQFEKDIEGVPYNDHLIAQNWGLAGILEQDKIIITKIPKYPSEYFNSIDSDEKRYFYCHCGRVRKQIREHKQTYSEAYCHCGGGYYKAIWEEILGKEVQLDVVETVLKGSTVCKFVLKL